MTAPVRRKVLLLNPPGRDRYMREYYCSKVSKAAYLTPPIDILVQSGIMAERHQVAVVDAVAETLSEDQCLERIRRFAPDAVLSMTGSVSWQEDFPFFQRIKDATGAWIAATGDVLMENGEALLRKSPFLDAILLDFTSDSVARHLAGEDATSNLLLEKDGKIVGGEDRKARRFDIPAPLHGMFPLGKYRLPYLMYHPFATVLTDYGCPYRCNFCIIATLGFKLRPVEAVLDELETIRDMGIREVFFIDQTFAASRKRTLELLTGMLARDLRLVWSCWTRVDCVDRELLALMKEAGCHTIQVGVESASQYSLDATDKSLDLGEVDRAILDCHSLGIRTLGTFLVGLPGEDEADVRRTMDLALRLPFDYASFNTLVPRTRTAVRHDLEARGVAVEELVLDQSGTHSAVSGSALTGEQIYALKQEANRRFYLRIPYMLRMLFGARTWWDLRSVIQDGLAMLGGMFRRS